MKGPLPWFFLLATVLLAVHTAEAVGHMGGYVHTGGKSKSRSRSRVERHRIHSTPYCGESYFGESIFGRSCYGRRPEEIHHHHHTRPKPTQRAETSSNHTGRPDPNRSSSGNGDVVAFVVIALIVILIACVCSGFEDKITDTTLMMIQVAVKNSSHEIQSDFSQFGRRLTQTDGEGMHRLDALRMLSETTSRILFHSDQCFAATSSVDLIKENRSWKWRFEEMCRVQMGKSDGRFVEQSVGRLLDEFVVVMILVAARGSHNLPAINCLADLKTAFSRLKSFRNHIEAVKVFWTPPNGRTKMLEDELFEEFPQLRPLDDQIYRTPTTNFRPPPSAPPIYFSNHQNHRDEAFQDEQVERLNPLLDVD